MREILRQYVFFYVHVNLFTELNQKKEKLELEEAQVAKELATSTRKLDKLREKIMELESTEKVNEQELDEYKKEKDYYEERVSKLEVKKIQIIQKKKECEHEILRIQQQSPSIESSPCSIAGKNE